ncbi:MAG: DUF799 family lipoprotein [Deltaproteobacteria bacterium]|nr:DUF799 family lipoprotein [Deltaproteobacteria bacterium]
MRKTLLFFFAAAIIVLTACAVPVRKYYPNYSNPVYSVAVLPFYNATNDVDGPRMIREEFFKRMQERHYLTTPIKEVDGVLLDQMGITLGSQLEMTSPQQLGEVLGVDGVLYGYVLNFDDITTGLYNVKKVRAGFKLVDTRTGAVVWSEGLGVKSALAGGKAGAGITILKEVKDEGIEPYKSINGIEEIPGLKDWHVMRAAATEKAGDAALISLGEKILTKAMGVHLRAETDVMLDRVMTGFPSGPGSSREAPRRSR